MGLHQAKILEFQGDQLVLRRGQPGRLDDIGMVLDVLLIALPDVDG